MRNPPLVLASTSRYRRELLARLGLPFEVAAPGVDESARPGEAPADTALRLAEAKARAVASGRREGLVIGSDQVAGCDGEALSKPETPRGRGRPAAATGRAHDHLPHRGGRC